MFVVIGIFFPSEDAFLISVDQRSLIKIINSLLVVNSLVSFNNIHDYINRTRKYSLSQIFTIAIRK